MPLTADVARPRACPRPNHRAHSGAGLISHDRKRVDVLVHAESYEQCLTKRSDEVFVEAPSSHDLMRDLCVLCHLLVKGFDKLLPGHSISLESEEHPPAMVHSVFGI